MSEIKWIKLSTGIFDNRKIRQIENMPDGDALVVIWLKILILAGETNDNGFIYFTKNIPYTDELLATQFGKPLTTIRLALETFRSFGMIEVVDDLILVTNWEKYQNVAGLEKIREQTRKRVARYRERQKLIAQDVTLHETLSNGAEKTKNKDKDKDKEYTDEFETVWQEYPKKQGKQNALKAYLKARKDGVDKDTVLNGIGAYKRYIQAENIEPRYIKQGSTWFAQRCWDDDYKTGKKTGFNGFDQRSYDYEDLTERLMSRG